MKCVIGGVVAPLVAFAVLAAGASDASATSTGESRSSAGGVLLLSGSVTMAPKPPQLSEEEKRAIENQKAGRPYDEAAFKRAKRKLIQGEKYNKERNKQKRRK
ncbi:MAG: hypothetical protein JO115_09990 [Pseudonocardiales bacterium]|nr:hypothetical protein [Pseudonocardiales bacterium]